MINNIKKIDADWGELLKNESSKDYFIKLNEFIEEEYSKNTIFPAEENIFNALIMTPYTKVKIVILGQDPYHGDKQAHGLSFSVSDTSAKFPPSLRNIFKELETDTGINRKEKNLSDWAEQGILLLNTVLTVEKSKAGSHQKKGWEIFTDEIIKKINQKDEMVVFVLWGAPAIKKQKLITNAKHAIVSSVHPSPLSAYNGFFGSKPFSQINELLKQNGKDEIKW